MKRVVVLGEFRADRLIPPLVQAGAEVVVLGFVELSSFLGSEVVCGSLPGDLTERDLLLLLQGYDADIAIPNMNSPGQEQMLPVYARAAAQWRATGRRMLVHSEEFATLSTDKVEFHRIAEQRGWPVPRGVICHDVTTLRAAVAEIGPPVLVKEARSESHAGRCFVAHGEPLGRAALGMTYPVLVQQAVAGEEFAVELITGPSYTVTWPVASLGMLDSDCAPGKQARVEPVELPDGAREALVAVIRDIVSTYRPAGPWQIDFAVSDGELHLIELNGRLGGLSNMSWASTGLDPHVAHMGAVLGHPLDQPRTAQVALELPVHNEAVLPAAPAGTELKSFPGNPANRVPYNAGYYRAVLKVPEGRADGARDWLLGLPPGILLIDSAAAVAQLTRAMKALEQGGAPLLHDD